MPLPYATPANVKSRLGITSTDKDTLLWRMCEEINTYIETVTKRAIGSSAVSAELLDGWDVQGSGYIIDYPQGLRSISSLEIRLTTTDSYATVPASDYFIGPSVSQRNPGWPGFYIALTDLPASTNSTPFVLGAYGAIRLSAEIGWDEMQADVRGVAEVAVSRALHSRNAGYADDVGADEWGEITVSRFLSSHDYRTLRRYAWKPVEII